MLNFKTLLPYAFAGEYFTNITGTIARGKSWKELLVVEKEFQIHTRDGYAKLIIQGKVSVKYYTATSAFCTSSQNPCNSLVHGWMASPYIKSIRSVPG
jgi:hypothetical protein